MHACSLASRLRALAVHSPCLVLNFLLFKELVFVSAVVVVVIIIIIIIFKNTLFSPDHTITLR